MTGYASASKWEIKEIIKQSNKITQILELSVGFESHQILNQPMAKSKKLLSLDNETYGNSSKTKKRDLW
jgi:D-hexose-6-phosphate mutarotase